jgi:spore photoproduct lyase
MPESLNIPSASRFTHQEQRQLEEAARDLDMWGEPPLAEWWQAAEAREAVRDARQRKRALLAALRAYMDTLRATPKSYAAAPAPARHAGLAPELVSSDRKVAGMCPVASPETVCCNLRTIDAVENCGFGCRYCTIQTFYGDRVRFDADLPAKLAAIEIEPHRFYHFGTGQSSDSLMWGNQHGVLDALCAFAAAHPNILLEFKTKSKNVSYFLDHALPDNIVLSWSLNTPTIIAHEELHTASLAQRLAAARRVADRGVRVAFHFHPLVWYDTWEADYTAVAAAVTTQFAADEVLFVSMGSVTFIKPVMKAIRARGGPTKMLQMPFARDPKGKHTYPDAIKQQMFSAVYAALAPWHADVFFYLCMEKAAFWHGTFGWCYPDNASFERAFGEATMPPAPVQDVDG